jgi:Fe-S cluster assembly iron-binding protein IscA
MLNVTERAKQELRGLLMANAYSPETGLRLTFGTEGQFGVTLDKERADDQMIEYEGAKVLLVTKELANILEKTTIDVEDTPEGARLAMFKES